MWSKFNFLKNHQTVFHSSYTILYFDQQYTRVSISPHPCQQLFNSIYPPLIIILVGVKSFYLFFKYNLWFLHSFLPPSLM